MRNAINKLLEIKQEEDKYKEPTDDKTNKSVDPLDKTTNKMTGKNQEEAKIPEKSKSKRFGVFTFIQFYIIGGKDHENFIKNIETSTNNLMGTLDRIKYGVEIAHETRLKLNAHRMFKYSKSWALVKNNDSDKYENEEMRLQELLEKKKGD